MKRLERLFGTALYRQLRLPIIIILGVIFLTPRSITMAQIRPPGSPPLPAGLEAEIHQACLEVLRDTQLASRHNIDPRIIEGIILTELHQRWWPKEDIEDTYGRVVSDEIIQHYKNWKRGKEKSRALFKDIFGKKQDVMKMSLGPAQMQIGNILDLVFANDAKGNPKYPWLVWMRNDALQSAYKPRAAAGLVAAYLSPLAENLQKGLFPAPGRFVVRLETTNKDEDQNPFILSLWKDANIPEQDGLHIAATAGDSQARQLALSLIDYARDVKTDALSITYNVGDGHRQAEKVRAELNKLPPAKYTWEGMPLWTNSQLKAESAALQKNKLANEAQTVLEVAGKILPFAKKRQRPPLLPVALKIYAAKYDPRIVHYHHARSESLPDYGVTVYTFYSGPIPRN